MLAALTTKQLLDWKRFAEQVGIGVRRNDIFPAQIASLIYNSHRKEQSRPIYPIEFMPYHEKPPELERIEMSDEEYENELRKVMPELFSRPLDTA